MRNYTAEDLDPFGSFDAPELDKVTHVLGVGDKVIVAPTGHRGKITNILHGKYYVTLPTGHALCCDLSDLVPADFPPSPEGKLAGFSGLIKAIKNETISAHDLVMAQRALEHVRENTAFELFGGAFDDGPSESMQILKALAERYQDAADAGDVLHKRASGFTVGQLVREKTPGFGGACRVGRVTKLQHGIVHVAFDGGVESIQVESSIEPAA